MVMFTYSPVSKTSVQVSIRLMASEPQKPGFEEREGIFQERNFRSASFIPSPIRIPRSSKGTSCKTAIGSGALRSDTMPETSGTAGTCAKANGHTTIIKKHITDFIILHEAQRHQRPALLVRPRSNNESGTEVFHQWRQNEKASMPR